MHDNSILHRDIKPKNIFITNENVIKLGDFGISCQVPSTLSKNLTSGIGTADYMAPELHKGQKYGFPADIWAIGIVLYELCTGCVPFKKTKDIIKFDFDSVKYSMPL